MFKRVILVGIICLLAIPAISGTTVAADDGQISGKLTNGTTNGDSVENVEVTLWSTQMGGQWEVKETVSTNETGGFVFSGLPIDVDGIPYLYRVVTEYKGVTYDIGSEIILQDSPSKDDLEVTVYDTKTTDEDIRLHGVQVYLYIDTDDAHDDLVKITVVEWYYFQNASDPMMVYVGTNGTEQNISFYLPEGTTIQDILVYDNGFPLPNIVETDNGFDDSVPIRPGMMQAPIYLSYRVETALDAYSFARSYPYDTQWVNVFVQRDVTDREIQVSSDRFQETDAETMEGETFLSWMASNIGVDESVGITVSGLHKTDDSNIVVLAVSLGVGIPVVLLICVLGYILIRRRSGTEGESQPTLQSTDSTDDDTLLREIADLDDQFEAGTIPKEEYDRLRAEKKAKLTELMRE